MALGNGAGPVGTQDGRWGFGTFRALPWSTRLGQGARYALAGALFAQIALLPLTTPRAVSIDRLREQLTAGEVTAVFFGDRVDPASSGRVAPVTHGLSVAANRPALT